MSSYIQGRQELADALGINYQTVGCIERKATSMNDAWDLSAPESLVIRDGPKAKPADVIKVALLELVTRRVLRLVEVETRDRRGRPKPEIVIRAGSSPAPVDSPLGALASVDAGITAGVSSGHGGGGGGGGGGDGGGGGS